MTLERRKAAGEAWETVEVENGGSQPTDTIFLLEGPEMPDPLPITAVIVGDGISIAPKITVTGNLQQYDDALANIEDVSAEYQIVGSTGNDGFYATSSVVYSSGPGTTLITLPVDSGPLPDATPDGSVQPPAIVRGTLDMIANSSVEWVLAETLEAWDTYSAPPYLWVGDSNDASAFSGVGPDVFITPGLFQWPRNTLATDGGFEALLVGTLTSIAYYPDPETITVIAFSYLNGPGGSVRVTVHHHSAEVGDVEVVGA